MEGWGRRGSPGAGASSTQGRAVRCEGAGQTRPRVLSRGVGGSAEVRSPLWAVDSHALARRLPLAAAGDRDGCGQQENVPGRPGSRREALGPELQRALGRPRGGGGGRWGGTLPAAPGCPSPSPPACSDPSSPSAWCRQQKLTRDPSDSSNQTSWRKANLTCKIAIDNLEKAELLRGGDPLRHRYLSPCHRRSQRCTSPFAVFETSAVTERLKKKKYVLTSSIQRWDPLARGLSGSQAFVHGSPPALDS